MSKDLVKDNALKSSYKHVEAFCLMLYQCINPTHVEILWNSRDGVTPFMIACRYCGQDAKHILWKSDLCVPDFKPPKGMRIFVDLTEDKSRAYLTKWVNDNWRNKHMPLCDGYDSQAEAIEALVKEDLKHVQIVDGKVIGFQPSIEVVE